MKIIGKLDGTKDYYDNGQNLGIDEDRIYLRNTKIMEFEHNITHQYFSIIGFCGKLYPFITSIDLDYTNYSRIHSIEDKAIRKSNIIFIPENLNNKELKAFLYNAINKTNRAIQKLNPRSSIDYRFNKNKDYLVEYNLAKNDKKILSLFHEYKEPIFYIPKYNWHSPKIVLNPRLKFMNFASVMSPTEAFQELSMYLGSELVDHPKQEISTGSDEVVANSKGHDRWSFRKQGINSKNKTPKKF